MKILITGAAGKTGRAIIKKGIEQGWSLRAWVRSADQAIEGITDYFFGDLEDPNAWFKGIEGIDAVYHICPNMHPAEIAIGRYAIGAAKAQRVSHFVYHSVLHPQTEDMPHHWHKMRVEEALLASGLPFTILQPTAYMQNLLPQLLQLKLGQNDQLSLPYPAESAISLVDLNDVATAVSIVLQQPKKYRYATLELVGTIPLSQEVIVDMCRQWLEREDVVFREIDLKVWERDNQGLAQFARETLLAMFRYYAKHGLAGSPAVLTAMLGRPPRSLPEWLESVDSQI